MFFFLYRILLFFKKTAFLSPLFTLFSLLILDSELFCINLRWMKLWFCESFNIIIHKLYHTCQNFLHMFRFGFFLFLCKQNDLFLTEFIFFREFAARYFFGKGIFNSSHFWLIVWIWRSEITKNIFLLLIIFFLWILLSPLDINIVFWLAC